MSSKLERDVFVKSQKLLDKWHNVSDELLTAHRGKTPVGMLGGVKYQVARGEKLHQTQQSLNRRKNILIICAIAAVVLLAFSSWIISPTNLIFVAIIIALAAPKLVFALVLYAITICKMKKTRAEYKQVVMILARRHFEAIKQTLLPVLGAASGKEPVKKIADEATLNCAWKVIMNDELPKGRRRIRDEILKRWPLILAEAKKPTLPPMKRDS